MLTVLALATIPVPANAQSLSPDPAPSTPRPDPAPARTKATNQKAVRPAPVVRVPAVTTTAAASTPVRSRPATTRATTARPATARKAAAPPRRPTRCTSAGGPVPCRVVRSRAGRAVTVPLTASTSFGAARATAAQLATAPDDRTRNAIAGATLLAIALAGSLTLVRARRAAA